jgi:hypothetical protein
MRINELRELLGRKDVVALEMVRGTNNGTHLSLEPLSLFHDTGQRKYPMAL